MSSPARVVPRPSAAVVLLLVIAAAAACSSIHSRSEPAGSPTQKLSETERIAHVLSRLTYGARSGDAERVAAMGVKRWIDQQLHPESIPDSAVTVALAAIPAWNRPSNEITQLSAFQTRLGTTTMAMLVKDSGAVAALKQATVRLVSLGSLNDMLYSGKIVRAQMSEQQLLEVISDFWENHFSVYSGKMPSPEALTVWDRDVLRPRALGKFRDLLGAVAHSPAMLFYLDNHLSSVRGLNENYARELLELHTLGVDGGYTQQDVIEVARALTGWTIGSRNPSVFAFRANTHDTGTKVVLGHTLSAGRGIEDGEEVLDILARHPSTARFIAFKLSRRLVSDDPPRALVERAAATFTRTDGDIAQVVRTIVTSPEFFSRAAFRAKVKTPFELVVSARRAVDAPADTTPATARLIAQLGQATFGWLTPDGWPEKGAAWMNSGMMYKRIKYGSDLANSGTIMNWRDWAPLSTVDFDHQAGRVMKVMLGGCPEPATRDAMLEVSSTGSDERFGDGRQRLRELLAIAFASPEFQRR
jgi:uncharacterized protein (DUF1800 family)